MAYSTGYGLYSPGPAQLAREGVTPRLGVAACTSAGLAIG